MIYLCIPAHNEQHTVGVVLWKVRQVMAGLERDYQLLVADDASTDRTPDVLEPYTRVLPLTVMRNSERRGYAASLEMLLREAIARSPYPKRDTVITLQADFTDDPAHVETLVKRIESGADIVVTNMLPAAGARRLDRWGQQLLNLLLRRLAWPDDVRDPLNGFTAYRLLCVKRAFDERDGDRLVRYDGRAANAQLLHDAAPHARRIEAVELQAHDQRRGRDPRTPFPMTFRQVLGLRRHRETEQLLPVARLAPDEIVGSNGRRSVFAETLRNGGRAARLARSRGQRGRGQRSQRRSDGAGPTDAGDTTTESASGDASADRGRSGDARRPQRPPTEVPAGALAERDESGETSAERKPPRRRRSRRGGRRRRTNGASPPRDVEASSSEDQPRVDSSKPPLEPKTPGA